MDLTGTSVLVTGANRGLGRALTLELLDRGVARVHAGARRPADVSVPERWRGRLLPLRLDVTAPQDVAHAADVAADVDLVVNNAGVSPGVDLLDGDPAVLDAALDVNLHGPVRMMRAFAPVLRARGGGAIVNVLSASSWFAFRGADVYHVAKAAAWAATNAARLELADQGTLVTGVHLGVARTDMTAGFLAQNPDFAGTVLAPSTVARAIADGVERDAVEILVDDWSRETKAALAADLAPFDRDRAATAAPRA